METAYVKDREWACFKLLVGNNGPELQYIGPHEPFREITFRDAGEFTSFIIAAQITKANKYDGVITREAMEHLTYINLKNLINHHPEKVNDTQQIYDDFWDLDIIIESLPDHYQRAEVAILNDRKREIISEYLIEYFGGEVEDKNYEY